MLRTKFQALALGFALTVLMFGVGTGARAGQSIDLSITYTDGVPSFIPTASLLYTATVTNNSAVAATNVTVTATLPGIAKFNNAANGGVFANGIVTWTVANLAAGDSTMLQYTADFPPTLAAGASKIASSTATVKLDPNQGTDPNLANNSATDDDVILATPDMAICSIEHAVECVPANGLLKYVISACDIGTIGVTGVVVKSAIPVQTTFVSADNSGTFADGVVTFSIANLPAKQKFTLTVIVKVNSPLPAGTTKLTNTVTISEDGLNGPDPDPSNNTQSVEDCIKPTADLQIVKVVDISDPNLGDTVVYDLTVTNNGPDNASNAVVSDKLPAGLTLVGVTQSAGVFDSNSGVWSIGALAAGASVKLTATCTVDSSASGSIDNKACVSNADEFDPNMANNCSTVSITPSCAKKPQIVSGPTASPNVAVAGVPQTFTVAVDNGGGQPVTATWNFGDGTTGTGLSVQHTYSTGGSYTVKVVVANSCGGAGTSVSLDQAVQGTPAPFECSLLRAPLNLARANSDSLLLLAQVNLPVGKSAAGEKITVQINDFYYTVQLDKAGKFKDARSTVSLKGIGSNALLTFKISKSSLRTKIIRDVPAQSANFVVKDAQFLIGVGSDFYGTKFDLQYTSKRNTGMLEK